MTIDDCMETIQRLWDTIADKDKEIRKLERELSDAEFRIRHELEPRIEAERRGYDRWALDPER